MDINASTEPKATTTPAADPEATSTRCLDRNREDTNQKMVDSKLNSLRRGIQHVVEQCPDRTNGCSRALCMSTRRLIKTYANHRCPLHHIGSNKAGAYCKVCKLWNFLMGNRARCRTSSSTTTAPTESCQFSALRSSATRSTAITTTCGSNGKSAGTTDVASSRPNQMILTMRFCILVDKQKGLYTAKLV